MDDYIKSVKEIKSQSDMVEGEMSNYRDLFQKFILSIPAIKVEQFDKGDVSFSISIRDIGLNNQDLQRLKVEIYSYMFVNFMGELLVRENINLFGDILTSISKENYSDIVNRYEHGKFGLKIRRNRFHFTFHISLVQDILNEDFKRALGKLEKS